MSFSNGTEACMQQMIGKRITSIAVENQTEPGCVELTFDDGSVYLMHHDQECCEAVWLADVDWDLQNHVGHAVLDFSVRTEENYTEEGHTTWSFYHLTTDAGTSVMRWCGTSNGYYGEEVTIKKLANGMRTCMCGCYGSHRSLPPGAWLTEIGGWHKVRLVTTNDISGSTEIGCGNTPAIAAEDAWEWYATHDPITGDTKKKDRPQ